MKFVIVNTDYPDFLRWLYVQNSELKRRSYEEQLRVRNESLFGVADFYSSNLRKLGHEAYDIHANNEHMQKAWAREHGIRTEAPNRVWGHCRRAVQQARHIVAKSPIRHLKAFLRPVLRSLDHDQSWFCDILAAQIRHYRPDVLLNHAVGGINGTFLKMLKPYTRILVGQIASPLPHGEDLGCYDLVISSLPNLVTYFSRLGISSELHRLGFEPAILHKLNEGSGKVPVSFVGSISPNHGGRIDLLEYLSNLVEEIEIWGQGIDDLPNESPIRRRYKGKAWGIEMYHILRRSQISLNHHIGLAENYANNMRLFEATGLGTLLITDSKDNLHEMYEPGKEVIAYKRQEECAELIRYYLQHDKEREAIARAGQQRTLREHTYAQRMQELEEIIGRYLGRLDGPFSSRM